MAESDSTEQLFRQLEDRTKTAIGNLHRRLERVERPTLNGQQLEDLMAIIPAVKSLLVRCTRIENILLMHQRTRESSIENDYIVAQEMVLIRDRVLTIEGRLACLTTAPPAKDAPLDADLGSREAGSPSGPKT